MVSYEEKTLIMWDMKAGAQKATFTADKVKELNVLLKVESFYLTKRIRK